MKRCSLIACLLSFCMVCGMVAQNQKMNPDFYDVTTIREIKINFPVDNWAEKLDSLRIYGGNSLLGNAVIDGKAYKNIGVRYRGSKSFKTGLKRNPLHLKLNYINKEQNHEGYKTLKLSNSLRDPSMVREVLSYEIAGQYLPTPKANYAKVFINDVYYGLLVNIEAVNSDFLTEHFGSSENSFFKAGPQFDEGKQRAGCKQNTFGNLEYESDASCYFYNYEIKSDNGWDDLIDLTKVLNEMPEKIESVLNVDRTLWMLAFNNVLVNLNSYSGQKSENFYLYKDDEGRFNPIVWDMNLSFGSFKNIGKGSDLNMNELQRLDPLLHADNSAKPLIKNLLENPLYKKIYLSHIRDIVYDHFENGKYQKRAEELQKLIRTSLVNDKNKTYTIERFDRSLKTTVGTRSKIPGISELMSVRTKFLKKHPKIATIPPRVAEVTVLKREKFSNQKVQTFQIQAKVDKLPKRVKLYYRLGENVTFQEVYMSDDGKSKDGEAGDKIFGAEIDPAGKADRIEYFIMAENAASASFDPPNYMFEPYSTTLEELN